MQKVGPYECLRPVETSKDSYNLLWSPACTALTKKAPKTRRASSTLTPTTSAVATTAATVMASSYCVSTTRIGPSSSGLTPSLPRILCHTYHISVRDRIMKDYEDKTKQDKTRHDMTRKQKIQNTTKHTAKIRQHVDSTDLDTAQLFHHKLLQQNMNKTIHGSVLEDNARQDRTSEHKHKQETVVLRCFF
jgi:hypothetical protein